MGFAAGVAAGRAAAPNWDAAIHKAGNPYAVASTLMQPGAGPRVIKNNAAEMALKQRELDLKEKEQALAALTQAQHYDIAQRTAAIGEQNAGTQATQAQNRTTQLANANAINERTAAVGERTAGVNERKQTSAEEQTARKNSFDMAKQSLAMNNPQGIMDYFNKYGNPKANIENIEFGPGDKGDMLVQFSGQQKPAYFKSKQDFYKSFMAFTDPKVEVAMIDAASKREAEKQKAAEKAKTANPHKVTSAQAGKEYERRWTDATGEPKPNAPDREKWINDYVTKHANMAGQGTAAAPAKSKGATVTGERASKDNSGNKLREWSDGTKEIVAPNGEVLYVMSPKGVRYSKEDKDPQNQLGYNRYLKSKEPSGMSLGKKKEALPTKAKKKPSHAWIEHVDPKTGDTIRTKMVNGRVVNEVVKKKKKKGISSDSGE